MEENIIKQEEVKTEEIKIENLQLQEEQINYNLEEFNTIQTTTGEIKFNEQMYIELKTTNLYLNLILIAVVLCFLYYTISKALKKLFYINI